MKKHLLGSIKELTTLSFGQRLVFAIACFAIAIIGFMIKLPSVFRHMDKELHAAFYFLAAAFLNLLFEVKKPFKHSVVVLGLFLFGFFIELAQSYSNRFFRTRIHGRFDPEDLKYNVMGLLAFTLLWFVVRFGVPVFASKPQRKKV